MAAAGCSLDTASSRAGRDAGECSEIPRMSAASGGQAPPEFSSTHPNPGTRIQNLQSLIPKAMEYRAKFCEDAQRTALAL